MTEQVKKTVILTGASRGIGHSTVQRFSDEGWQIISCSRDDIPDHCKRDPNWVHHFPTDLAEPASVDAFVKQANALIDNGPVHALVNNAAISPKTPYQERLGCLNGDLDRWREVFELNLFAPLVLARGFAAALRRGAKQGGGLYRQYHIHRGARDSPVRGFRLFDIKSRPVRLDAGNGRRICPIGRSGQRRRPR